MRKKIVPLNPEVSLPTGEGERGETEKKKDEHGMLTFERVRDRVDADGSSSATNIDGVLHQIRRSV